MGNSRIQEKPPAKVATDVVVPLGVEDDRVVFHGMATHFMMKFDDALDPEKLRGSLEKLLDRHDWRKLGARLRLNENKKLEYHIPARFDEKRPAIAYSHDQQSMNISEHPLASRLPKASSVPAVVGDPSDFRSLYRRPNGPTKLADYIYTDEPQISLHIVSFHDATLVSCSWLHTLTDVLGRKDLLDAWSLVLCGRDHEVPPLHGFDFDPLASLHEDAKETYKLADKALSKFQLVRFGLRYAWNSFLFKDEHRVVCIPAYFVKDLHQAVLRDVKNEANNQKTPAVEFVSEGDVLCAWWLRYAAAHIRRVPSQTIAIFNPVNIRRFLGKDLLPKTSAYVGNANVNAGVHLQSKDVFKKPLWHTALALRLSLIEQTTQEQIRAQIKSNRATIARTGHEPLYGDGGMHMIRYSNWTKANLFQTDFSAAVMRKGIKDANRSTKAGRPSYVQYDLSMERRSPRNSFPIYGKDAQGNYWLGGWLRQGVWGVIAQKLRRLR